MISLLQQSLRASYVDHNNKQSEYYSAIFIYLEILYFIQNDNIARSGENGIVVF